jgi:hypothetical protein
MHKLRRLPRGLPTGSHLRGDRPSPDRSRPLYGLRNMLGRLFRPGDQGGLIAAIKFLPTSLSVNQMKVKLREVFSGPGSRALPAETMRRLPFSGPVGPTGLGFPAMVCDPGKSGRRSPDGPASSCGSRCEPPGKELTRPMLSAGNALDPGPRQRLSPK